MAKIDPWQKAVECEQSLKSTSDPGQRAVVQNLRDLWIALGNEQSMSSDQELTKDIEKVDQLHVGLLGGASLATLH